MNLKIEKLKRRIKRTGIYLLLILGGIWFFLVYNNAPVLSGEIAYGIEYKAGLNLDVYYPTEEKFKKRPVVIYVHGGAWLVGRKESVNNARFNGAFNTLRDKGYIVVSPEYTLARKSNTLFPTCIEDVRAALAWVKDNAEEYQFDLNNVGIMGESAGAHISMMVAMQETSILYDNPIVELQYLVDVYGPTDLYQLYQDQSKLVGQLDKSLAKLPQSLNENLDVVDYLFGFDPAADTIQTKSFSAKYSPVNYIHNEMPPIMIIHGNADGLVPYSQSIILKKALEEKEIGVEFHSLEGVAHGFRYANSKQKEKVQGWIQEFILEHYQKND